MTAAGRSANRAMLVAVARRLAPLSDELVYVGGQVAELLVTEPAAVRVRGTDDVDAIAGVGTRTAYERLSVRLHVLGLRLDSSEGAPVCRWLTPEGLRVDVMPIAEAVFGLSAPWFAEATASARQADIGDGLSIRIPSAAAFLAMKWAAFADRGRGDLFGSHDLEDIVTVVAGRECIVADVADAPAELRAYVARETGVFLESPLALDAVEGALPDARFDAAVVDRTLERFRAIAGSGVRR